MDLAGCIYTFMHLYIVIITIKEKETMNFQGSEGDMGVVGGSRYEWNWRKKNERQ